MSCAQAIVARLEAEFGSGRWKSLRGSLSDLHLARSHKSSRCASSDLAEGAAAGVGHAGPAAAAAVAAASLPSGAAAEARGAPVERSGPGAAGVASGAAEQEAAGHDVVALEAGLRSGASAQSQHVASSASAVAEAGAAGPALGLDEAGDCANAPGARLASRSFDGRALPPLPETHESRASTWDGCKSTHCGSVIHPSSSPDPGSDCAPAGAQRASQPSRLRGGEAAVLLARVVEHPLPSCLDDGAGAGGGRGPAPTAGAAADPGRVCGAGDAHAMQRRGAARPMPVPRQAHEVAAARPPQAAQTPFTAAAQTPFSPPETPLAFGPGSQAAWPGAAPADVGHLVVPGGPGMGTRGAPVTAPDCAAGGCPAEGAAEGSADGSAGGSAEQTPSQGSSVGDTGGPTRCGMTPPANACSLADDPRAGKAASFESFEAAINAALAALRAERQRPASAPAHGAGLRSGFGPGSQPSPALEACTDWAAPLRLAMPKLRVKVASPRTAGLSGSESSHASMPPAQALVAGGAPGSGTDVSPSAPENPAKPCRSAPLARSASVPFSPLPPLPARPRAPVLAGKGQGQGPGPGPEPGRRGWLPDTPLAGPSDAGGPYSVQHRASYGCAEPHAGAHGAQVGHPRC